MLLPVLICGALALTGAATSVDASSAPGVPPAQPTTAVPPPVAVRLTPARDIYRSGNYAEALRQLKPRAEQGEAEAQYYLGYIYERGEGVSKDMEQAASWYRRAADGGQARAQYKLALGYALGLANTKKDEAEAVKWLKKSAAGGYRRAQRTLARVYAEGRFGVPRDAAQAEYWARQASVQP